MKKISFVFLVLLFPLGNSFALFQPVEGISSAQIKRVVISPFNSLSFYVASKNCLYQSHNGGSSFEKVAVFKDEEIRHVFYDRYLAGILYVATARHIYKISDKLEKIFSCFDEAVINTAVKHQGKIYVGASNGVRYASSDLLNWKTLPGLSDVEVYSIEPCSKGVYLAASKGIYFVDNEHKVKRLFVMRESEEGEGLMPNVIKVDIFDEGKIWLGTNQGLFSSLDYGETWSKLYIEGIDSIDVSCLSQTALEKNTFYIGTSKGFFKIDFPLAESKQIFEGIYSPWINWIEFSSSGEIYLATSKGLFKNNYFTMPLKENPLQDLLDEEPAITEIQQAALRYNAVDPERIKRWSQRLKYRALFPNIDLNYDKTIGYSVSKNGEYFGVGPRDWGVSFSWDVGDLIWNSYEDDVDTRGRLITQLRLDILDEINRVYFERLRLKKEIASSTLPAEKLFQKRLRLKELTATLDGYTGGYFSRRKQELQED